MSAMRAKLACLVVAGVLPGVALAGFSGRVVSVSDGDSLTVLVDRVRVRVRLVDIDAPELAQTFGKRSRQSLSDMCAGKAAQVIERGKDRTV